MGDDLTSPNAGTSPTGSVFGMGERHWPSCVERCSASVPRQSTPWSWPGCPAQREELCALRDAYLVAALDPAAVDTAAEALQELERVSRARSLAAGAGVGLAMAVLDQSGAVSTLGRAHQG